MKIHSNIAFSDVPQRWKAGQWIIFNNHKDNGIQDEESAGSRYEADFTIIKELTAEATILAFTRMTQDPDLEQKVVDTIEVNEGKAIDVVIDYPTKVSASVFPPLPDSGALKTGQLFSYQNGAVMVVQDHERTIYAPELTPALFSFYRDNASVELEWMEGEKVEKGWERTFGGKTFECLQSHQTLAAWTPDITPALWKEVIVVLDIPVWVQPTGAHDAYRLGAKVHYPTIADPIYESLIDYNTYSPVAYPAGWIKL